MIFELATCPECGTAYHNTPFMRESLASVAISRNLTVEQMARRFFREYHAKGHPDLPDRAELGRGESEG